ncbi:MAG: hypothetical protein U0559_02620 [Anaerolineae bacterium]
MANKLKRTYHIIGIVVSQIVNVPFVAVRRSRCCYSRCNPMYRIDSSAGACR